MRVIEPIPYNSANIAIRAHQISFTNDSNQENTFPCWLGNSIETPQRMTLFLKLHNPPESKSDYDLQAEIFKEKWATIKDRPLPWYVRLDSLRLILME